MATAAPLGSTGSWPGNGVLMSTTIRRVHITRGAVLAATAALALSLLPGTAASADVPTAPTLFSYIGHESATANRILWSNVATGELPAPATPTATALTPTDGYQVFNYDMAESGDTWVATMQHGSPTDDQYDSTYALVLVHRFADTSVATRVLATNWNANPVINTDGSTVWWLANDKIYKFAAVYTETAGLTPASIGGSASVVSTGQFVTAKQPASAPPFPVETPARLAISPSGLNAAVLFFDDTSAAKARVRASTMSTATVKPATFEKLYTTTAISPSSNSFVFLADSTTLLYDEVNISDVVLHPDTGVTVTLQQVTAALPAALVGTSTTTPNVALKDVYDVRPFAGLYAMWQDRADLVDATKSISAFWWQSDPSITPVDPPTDRTDGPTTFRYVPTATTPPPMVAATNLVAPHPSLTVSAKTALVGRRVAYNAHNYYLQDPLGAAYVEANASEVDRGTLYKSIDGAKSWILVGTTSGAHPILIGGNYFYGYSPVLTRNTQFRWRYDGDLFTASGYTGRVLITVLPVVTAKRTFNGSSRIVAGKATRVGGTAVLYRVVGTKSTRIASAVISATGIYSFGKRHLTSGTYKVVTVADVGWGSGSVKVAV